MSFNVGDRVRVISAKLNDGEMFGETGHIVRNDGAVWHYGVVMDKPEMNSIGGFNWLSDDEMVVENEDPHDSIANLSQACGNLLKKMQEVDDIAQEERERADMWRGFYENYRNKVESSQPEDDDVDEKEEYIIELKYALAEVCRELLSVAADADDYKSKIHALSVQNAELSAALEQEQVKTA